MIKPVLRLNNMYLRRWEMNHVQKCVEQTWFCLCRRASMVDMFYFGTAWLDNAKIHNNTTTNPIHAKFSKIDLIITKRELQKPGLDWNYRRCSIVFASPIIAPIKVHKENHHRLRLHQF